MNKQIVNLTNERKLILSFLPIACQNYYILSEFYQFFTNVKMCKLNAF
jgi:hypothetical protein